MKAGYFCEFCNVLLLTAMKVEFHTTEENHIQNRGAVLLKSSKNGIIAFKNVNISELAWHGMMNDICFLCDIEVEDEKLHKNNVSHILNLIQKPIKFGANDAIYRQVSTFCSFLNFRGFIQLWSMSTWIMFASEVVINYY